MAQFSGATDLGGPSGRVVAGEHIVDGVISIEGKSHRLREAENAASSKEKSKPKK